jgi:hypothetical protein
MTNQQDEEKSDMRIMWVASGLVVLFIVGLMLTIGNATPPVEQTSAVGHEQTASPK